jgi:hypothetical protein
MGPYTVTKANQNETLLWKIAVLEMKKPPVGARAFFLSPMLVFYIPPCQKCQRRAYSFIFCPLMQGNQLTMLLYIGQDQYCTPKDLSLILPCSHSFFFSQIKSLDNSLNVFWHGGM